MQPFLYTQHWMVQGAGSNVIKSPQYTDKTITHNTGLRRVKGYH